MHDIGPFSIPAMRDFVPEKLRPWIVIAIVIVFQLSGGVYLAAVSEMVGSTALLQDDGRICFFGGNVADFCRDVPAEVPVSVEDGFAGLQCRAYSQ